MDTFDLPGLDPDEREYLRAEREGKRLNDLLCDECPDPGLCGSLRSCQQEEPC